MLQGAGDQWVDASLLPGLTGFIVFLQSLAGRRRCPGGRVLLTEFYFIARRSQNIKEVRAELL